jgi:tRNA(Ile2)-agmatinylcytidine synthase
LRLHVGLDDTDSPQGGCTTYIAARLVERLLEIGARFVDYPNLLRLNPNVPWKTRGNGAVCLRVEIDGAQVGPVKRAAVEEVEAGSRFDCGNTNPGIVFLEGEVPEPVKHFSERVVGGVVTLDEAAKLLDGCSASAVGYKNMRGVIGALAAVGGLQGGDHTYELLSYREPGNWGTPRRLEEDSVAAMDEAHGDDTFNNIDCETGQVLIAPHGPDPVLYGVRGETPEAVHGAAMALEAGEPLERWVIYRSNQGTDGHLRPVEGISALGPYQPAVVEGELLNGPRTIKGGHVIFGLGDDTGAIDCAAYEPTGSFRKPVRLLLPGDVVRVYAGGSEARPRRAQREPLLPGMRRQHGVDGEEQGFQVPEVRPEGYQTGEKNGRAGQRDQSRPLHPPAQGPEAPH